MNDAEEFDAEKHYNDNIGPATEKLEAAIQAYVSTVTPLFPIATDWYLVGVSVGVETRGVYYHYPISDSPIHHIQGLHKRGGDNLDLIDALDECDDPDHDHG